MKTRFIIVSLICLVFLESTALLPADDAPPANQKTEVPSPYQSFVDGLLEASKVENPADGPKLFDAEAMLHEVLDEDMQLPPAVMIAVNAQLQLFMNHQFVKDLRGTQKIRILSSEPEPSGTRGAIVIRMVGEDETVTRCRFWLVKSNERWLAYDYQDFALGVRSSVAIRGAIVELNQNPALRNSGRAMIAIMGAAQALEQGDVDELKQILERIEGIPLPTFVDALRLVLVAGVAESESRTDDALEALLQAARLQPDLVLVDQGLAGVYAELGKYELSAEAAERYLKAVIEDDDVTQLLVAAYEQLGQLDKARTALNRQLSHNPESIVTFARLCRLAEDKDVEKLAAYLKTTEYPDAVFKGLFESFMGEEETQPAAKRLIAVFSRVQPESALLDEARGRLLFLEEKYREAATHYHAAAKKSDGDELKEYATQYYNCFEHLKEPLEAYETFFDKTAVFSLVCDRIRWSNPEEFAGLLKRHEQQFPDDLNVPYYRGADLDERLHLYAEADAQFAKVVPDGRTDEHDLPTDFTRRWFAMHRRIHCHLELGTWREAFQKLPYPNFVAHELAETFRDQVRGDDLESLLNAYEQENIPDSKGWIFNQRIWVLFLNEKYADVIKRVDAISPGDSGPKRFEGSDWHDLRILRFKALLRLNNLERAEELADDEWYLIQVAAAGRDIAATKQAMIDKFGEIEDYSYLAGEDSEHEVLLRRDDFAVLFGTDAKMSPPPAVVLLYEQPHRLSASELEGATQALRTAFGLSKNAWSRVIRDNAFAFNIRVRGEVRTDWFSYSALQHDSNFFGAASRLASLTDERLRTVAGGSGGWVAISQGHTSDAEQVESDSRAMTRMVMELAEQTKPAAIYLTKTRRVALLTPELKANILKNGLETALESGLPVPMGELPE